MTWFHSYYAVSCIDVGICRTVIAYDKKVVGVGVFYAIPRLSTGVIYYVAVLPEHRGRGTGKAIIASIEEILSYEDIGIFIATTRKDNTASRKMLKELGYVEIELESLSDTLEELITMMTCGYEDDILYIKSGGIDITKFFSEIVKPSLANTIESIWRKICYRPWVKLRSS